ncbi:MAG TPA: DUF3426 domain-containing protein [Kiloniellaceae bacterium]
MIVSCPACESRFQVDREQLGYDGRIVRCGKCGNCWHQMPENDPRAAIAATAAAVAADGPPMPGRRRGAPPKKKSGGLAVGWILLLLFIAGLAAGGWLERERIVARFPQLADVYALAGVPVAASGPVLQLSDVALNSAEDAGDTVITVRGVITNISDRKQTLPMLRAQLTDSAGAMIAEWSFDPPRGELDAGASAPFETETRNPPEGAQNLSITFAGSQ